jgi:hypothetical protein
MRQVCVSDLLRFLVSAVLVLQFQDVEEEKAAQPDT